MKNKVFLDDLKRYENGLHKGKINWKNNIGEIVKCIYNDEIYSIKIIGYEEFKRQILTIEYEKRIDYIHTGHFCDCKFGKILMKITNEFKVEVGATFNDKNGKRNITIMDKCTEMDNVNIKSYKYKCNICGFVGIIDEYSLINRDRGCSCCASKVIISGVNDLLTKRPDLEKYIVDADIARNLAYTSGKKIKTICPFCKYERMIAVRDMVKHNFNCPRCSDNITIPEKFFIDILIQLGVEFKTQYNPTWSKGRRYDFYIPSLNMLVETHGLQHYEETSRGRTLSEEQENDVLKYNMAINNNIEHYIVIDCRYSELDWMKNNIIKSNLNNFFDLSKINFEHSFKFSITNNIRVQVKEKWNNKDELTTSETISNELSIDKHTVIRYLKFWNSLGMCDYDPKEESKKGRSKSGKLNGRKIEIFRNELSLGVFESATELERVSMKLFGVKLDDGSIGKVAKGLRKEYKGFTFKYV